MPEDIGRAEEPKRTEDLCVLTDFSKDTPGYWDDFWDEGAYGRHGRSKSGEPDPDEKSKVLRAYHRLLWSSEELPNGQFMELENAAGNCLKWNGMLFSSDTITTEFRGVNVKAIQSVLEDVADNTDDYRAYVEGYLHEFYTIGGFIIFPCHAQSMNQKRGAKKEIRDRWDLTLECIRRHYAHEDSPLAEVCKEDEEFYKLFGSFEKYVDFFYLQDCVVQIRDDPKTYAVKFWIGDGDVWGDPFPKSITEYRTWIAAQRHFVACRNQRIADAIHERSPERIKR